MPACCARKVDEIRVAPCFEKKTIEQWLAMRCDLDARSGDLGRGVQRYRRAGAAAASEKLGQPYPGRWISEERKQERIEKIVLVLIIETVEKMRIRLVDEQSQCVGELTLAPSAGFATPGGETVCNHSLLRVKKSGPCEEERPWPLFPR